MLRRNRVQGRRKVRRRRRMKLGRFWARTLMVGKVSLSLAMILSLTLFGYTLYQYIQNSTQLNVGEIKVMGCMNATESELLDLAKINFKASLMNLDLQGVSRRIALHPWVEKAKVRRDWARKALIIEVQERTPQALILLEDLYLVDRHGEIFKKAETADQLDFPVLTGVTRQQIMERDQMVLDLIHQALDLLDLLKQKRVFSTWEVSEINLNKQKGLTIFTLNGGIPIRLGRGGLPEKLSRLEKVLPDLQWKSKEVEYLDLNYSRKVIVKEKEAEAEKPQKS